MKAIADTMAVLGGFRLARRRSARPVKPRTQREHRDWQAVRTLAEQHADVNAAQPDGTTALAMGRALERSRRRQAAAGLRRESEAREPLRRDSALRSRGRGKRRHDRSAAESGRGCQDLDDGGRRNRADDRGPQPAASDAVKILLDHGADVNAKENYRGQTALMWAAAEHHAEVVKLLLDHGADWKVLSHRAGHQHAQAERGFLGDADGARRAYGFPLRRARGRYRNRTRDARRRRRYQPGGCGQHQRAGGLDPEQAL